MLNRILLLLFIILFLSPGRIRHNNTKPFEDEDRADLAMKQEFELTKDPATGRVPRERLMIAYKYAQQLRQQMAEERSLSTAQWEERGPNNYGGRTRAIMIDPNDATNQTVFAAGVDGGLWKTTTISAGSPGWVSINDFFANLAITTLTYDPNNTTTMYFGTGEPFYNEDAVQGDGIWKSTDGGTTWNQLSSTTGGNFNFISRIVVSATNSYVFAATQAGLYQSTDGGTTWTNVLSAGNGASNSSMADVQIGADGSVWAASGIFSTDGVYKAPADGNAGTFTKQNTGTNGFPTSGYQRIALACAPSDANTVYALTQDSSTDGIFHIYKTANGGTSWTTCANPVDADPGIGTDFTRGQAWYDLICAVDPNNKNHVFIGGIDLFKSTNGGTSWSQITHWYGGYGYQYVHADQHALVFQKGSSDTLYFGNDGGIWVTGNANVSSPTITDKDTGYNVTQFYACAMHPTAGSNYFLAGAQDNGSQQFTTSGINSTNEVTGGDGCFCHIDQLQPLYQWTSYVYNTFYRSTDGGTTWTEFDFNNGSFVNPSGYDNNSKTMYAYDSAGLYLRWVNAPTANTASYIYITNFASGNITTVCCSQNTTDRVFFGLDNGSIVRVDNAGTVASGSAGIIVGTPVAGASVSCVAVENGNDNHILVTYSNYGVTSVWESTNALSASPTFTSDEGNLPDMPVRWALFNPSNNQQAMLATEVGVWSTDLLSGASTAWTPSNTGLANVRTDMLQLRAADTIVAAATHGRGLFISGVFTTPDELPVTYLYINGEGFNNYNEIAWATASEVNNNGFWVLKSVDGISFKRTGFVKGAGTTTEEKQYTYIDDSMDANLYYYKIDQVDYDGHENFSNIIAVANNHSNMLSISNAFYNHLNDQISVMLGGDFSGSVVITLFDMNGRMIYRKDETTFSGRFINEPAELSAGVYIIKIDSEKYSVCAKVVK